DFIAVVMYPYYKETSYAGEEDRQESAHAAESDREAAAGHGLFRGESPGGNHRAPADRHRGPGKPARSRAPEDEGAQADRKRRRLRDPLGAETLVRVVLDTNVLISALLFTGAPSGLVPLWRR